MTIEVGQNLSNFLAMVDLIALLYVIGRGVAFIIDHME